MGKSTLSRFVIGSIVTVMWEESMQLGNQGEVVEIRDSNDSYNIGVKFKDEYEVIFFRENQLRKNADWTRENKAERLFEGFHSLFALKHRFDPNAICTHKGCRKKNSQRGMFNYVGSVYEVDLCDEHFKKWHGHCVESAPWE